jgi:hypothetical protein
MKEIIDQLIIEYQKRGFGFGPSTLRINQNVYDELKKEILDPNSFKGKTELNYYGNLSIELMGGLNSKGIFIKID